MAWLIGVSASGGIGFILFVLFGGALVKGRVERLRRIDPRDADRIERLLQGDVRRVSGFDKPR
jgi:hypothetical protein